ncbi:hypothetical protein HBI26_022870 [Parastagonospora nodorum]|nr:hypothetical protein HBH43_020110 [Parastagonospora nodorum]KAH5230037.1 hypothetical protein HBH68_014110 [Parastagonospora nodorum]KAH5338032.1 hypothetical protein HBI12_017370 [Parastagonospora nodorum]KAH5437556.1 hypothetical protein HBI32_028090 [Parastagonospora nodorum]KAH5610567.1 hypothetical protein HBI26_022870 [Parastagonospora nodorum]
MGEPETLNRRLAHPRCLSNKSNNSLAAHALRSIQTTTPVTDVLDLTDTAPTRPRSKPLWHLCQLACFEARPHSRNPWLSLHWVSVSARLDPHSSHRPRRALPQPLPTANIFIPAGVCPNRRAHIRCGYFSRSCPAPSVGPLVVCTRETLWETLSHCAISRNRSPGAASQVPRLCDSRAPCAPCALPTAGFLPSSPLPVRPTWTRQFVCTARRLNTTFSNTNTDTDTDTTTTPQPAAATPLFHC